VLKEEESGGADESDLGFDISHLCIGRGEWDPNGLKRFAQGFGGN
jgi:hypothetical protein